MVNDNQVHTDETDLGPVTHRHYYEPAISILRYSFLKTETLSLYNTGSTLTQECSNGISPNTFTAMFRQDTPSRLSAMSALVLEFLCGSLSGGRRESCVTTKLKTTPRQAGDWLAKFCTLSGRKFAIM